MTIADTESQARPAASRPPVGRWFRCYESLMDDPKVLALPYELRWAVLVMWCLTSKNEGVLPSMKQIAIGLRVRVDKCERIVEQLENNGLLTREEFEESGETIEHLYPHNWASRQHLSKKSTKRVKELRKRTVVSPPFHPREQIQSTETDTELVSKNARPDAKKNGFETDHQQPKTAQSQPAEHRQPAPAEAPKAVNGHPANLPDSEPFGLNDPWGDLQNDIVFRTETTSKGTIPYPDCNALREWKKDGLDVNVVRQVVMEGIKRKPVGTLFYFDKPVRERDAQLKGARSRPAPPRRGEDSLPPQPARRRPPWARLGVDGLPPSSPPNTAPSGEGASTIELRRSRKH